MPPISEVISPSPAADPTGPFKEGTFLSFPGSQFELF